MLSLILPTYNEAENLPELLAEIEGAMGEIPFEIIVVDDDSPDRTWEVAQRLAQEKSFLHVLRRVGRRGLSSAVLDGFRMARGDILAVMDSDGQHDPRLLPHLYGAVRRENAGIAIGSRYVPGGSVEGWARARHAASYIATGLAWLVCPRRVRDPMSGFFALDRRTFAALETRVHPRGFKILLEFLALLPPGARVAEAPLAFRLRRRGESKLNARVEAQYLLQICSLLLRRFRWSLLLVVACVVLFVLLFPRAWALRLLYTNAAVRAQVREGVERLATERGWLRSDISFRSVRRTGFSFLHRQHVRGRDPIECFTYSFSNHVLRGCGVESPLP